VVPQPLSDDIRDALAAVDDARAQLARTLAARAPLRERRDAHLKVTHAFDEADALLRQATALAKQRSYRDWSLWRHRLSSLDVARQIHLFAELDDSGLLPIGSVRAIDTGMSGPGIGDVQHGQTRPPGTVPGYGLDLEALLGATATTRPAPAKPFGQAPTADPGRSTPNAA
jgi:hypothetical protein